MLRWYSLILWFSFHFIRIKCSTKILNWSIKIFKTLLMIEEGFCKIENLTLILHDSTSLESVTVLCIIIACCRQALPLMGLTITNHSRVNLLHNMLLWHYSLWRNITTSALLTVLTTNKQRTTVTHFNKSPISARVTDTINTYRYHRYLFTILFSRALIYAYCIFFSDNR